MTVLFVITVARQFWCDCGRRKRMNLVRHPRLLLLRRRVVPSKDGEPGPSVRGNLAHALAPARVDALEVDLLRLEKLSDPVDDPRGVTECFGLLFTMVVSGKSPRLPGERGLALESIAASAFLIHVNWVLPAASRRPCFACRIDARR